MTEGTDCKDHARFDEALGALCAAKSAWVKTGLDARIRILGDIKAGTAVLAEAWAETAARKKLLPEGSPLAAEEWLSGPYGLITACDGLIATLTQMENRAYLKDLPKRYLPSGQLGVEVFPASWRDRLFLSGISAEVWMQKGVSEVNLASHCAPGYGAPAPDAKVALVLGAGNIASIAPLDCFQKLFQEQQVVLLKMNPVNAYLVDFLEIALAPLIARDALRIVTGGAEAGRYLTQHPRVDEIHITGSGATHDAIVWGSGKAGQAAKAARTPKNTRRITSELGAVCPTIVVPGPWSAQDIRFQAQHIATQKLHNGGYNCIACQALILPEDWSERAALMRETKRVLARNTRLPFYPGTQDRLNAFRAQGETHEIARADAPALVMGGIGGGKFGSMEVFGPAMSVHELPGAGAAYLEAAIGFANAHLHGTLGANIIIHPKTLREIGKPAFERLLGDLRYGIIGVNAWAGVGFLIAQVPWGAFPGHSLDDVQSGIGVVHNSYMFERPERTVIYGPFAPFPRSFRLGQRSLLPKPPWFITHRHAHKVAKSFVALAVRATPRRALATIFHAMRG